ncbi:metallophosphoesterase [Desulforhopalus singaporensis]|uniref:Serine/threonine protein phosphatase 1 n=1 Tax=Desulforhopalus singaporensis TaxID=91360 RepID=A0A1H0KKB1_9BACT|nr:metallophosphoesterase [Desulforhopalus singaporensis]SDO56434.1 serine/threonine protein phosphatase 1 [Desulforhopalus singaporensis]
MAESDEKVFCIGDIHGCFDRLTALIDLLPVDRTRDTLVFLGDYINRGPDSAKVVEKLLEIEETHHRVIFLKGNHEQMLLEYAETSDVELVPSLRMMGIEATAASYGARVQSLQKLSCFPERHQRFFHSLRFAWHWNGYIFTHADITDELIGKYAGGDTLAQHNVLEEAQLLCGRRFWERGSFINDVTVVFGHTPFLTPLVLPHQICIDTGAVYGNMLTAMELPGKRFYHG